jgi:hypothetical protein
MVETIKKQSGQLPEELLADAGYCSEENIKYVNKKGIDS